MLVSTSACCCHTQLRQLDAWYREETDRWTNEREEMVKKCSQLEHKHTQFQHELRRRDTEFERLQKHLAQQIAATERRRRVSSCSGASSSSGNSSTMVLSSFGSGSFKQGRCVLRCVCVRSAGGARCWRADCVFLACLREQCLMRACCMLCVCLSQGRWWCQRSRQGQWRHPNRQRQQQPGGC